MCFVSATHLPHAEGAAALVSTFCTVLLKEEKIMNTLGSNICYTWGCRDVTSCKDAHAF